MVSDYVLKEKDPTKRCITCNGFGEIAKSTNKRFYTGEVHPTLPPWRQVTVLVVCTTCDGTGTSPQKKESEG